MSSNIFQFILFLLIISAVPAEACRFSNNLRDGIENLFRNGSTPNYDRASLEKLLVKEKIPSFIKLNASNEKVPVVLINRESRSKVKKIFDNSFGTMVKLQPSYGNDHGMLRIGQNIIDLDAPGQRGFGELHNTGLSWKGAGDYISRRRDDDGVILEVLYSLNREESDIIDLYQRVRRAAVFKTKFTFGNFKTPDDPMLLRTGGEHCFVFCKGGAVSSHISEVSNSLHERGFVDLDAFLKRDDVKDLMGSIEATFLYSDSKDLSLWLLDDDVILRSWRKILNSDPSLKREDDLMSLRLLLTYNTSKNYKGILEKLGVTSSFGVEDIKNPRATAILVYDQAADVKKFKRAEYKPHGAFVNWPNTEQFGLGLRP